MPSTVSKPSALRWVGFGLIVVTAFVATTTEAPFWVLILLGIASVVTIGFAALRAPRPTSQDRQLPWGVMGLLAAGVVIAKNANAPVWLFSCICVAFVLTMGFAALRESRTTRDSRT